MAVLDAERRLPSSVEIEPHLRCRNAAVETFDGRILTHFNAATALYRGPRP